MFLSCHLQWIAQRSYHLRMKSAARQTDAFQKEARRCASLGLPPPEVQVRESTRRLCGADPGNRLWAPRLPC